MTLLYDRHLVAPSCFALFGSRFAYRHVCFSTTHGLFTYIKCIKRYKQNNYDVERTFNGRRAKYDVRPCVARFSDGDWLFDFSVSVAEDTRILLKFHLEIYKHAQARFVDYEEVYS